jgi:uncharacterized protein YqhQ
MIEGAGYLAAPFCLLKRVFIMVKKFHYGGQAVIEGVMMRGQKNMVTAVRQPNGEVVLDIQPLPTIYTGRMRKIPLLRGIIVLIEALVLGIKTLLYSANVALGEEEEEISGVWLWAMVVISVALAVVLFFISPLFLTRLIQPYINSSLVFHLIEGSFRLAIFIIYLKLVSLLPDIKRVFAYHGAEHKAVNAYEDGAPLEVEAATKYSTAHPRCGTGFLFVVLIIAIIVFSLIGLPSLWLMVLWRIILIPVIAAISYEIIQFGAGHAKNAVVRAVMAPGLLLQAMTTREPDDSQLEVALSALKKAIEVDQPEEAAQAPSD